MEGNNEPVVSTLLHALMEEKKNRATGSKTWKEENSEK